MNGMLYFYEICKEEEFKNKIIDCLNKQANLEMIGTMQATCVTAYWLSFLNRLFLIYNNGSVIDEAEKTIYNALLGAIDTTGAYRKRDGNWFMIDSFSPMTYGIRACGLAGGQKINDINYGCCVVTGTIGVGMIPSLSFSKYDKGIKNNFYYSGTVNTKTPNGSKISIKTTTNHPKYGDIFIDLSLDKNEEMAFSLRIPS